jgi:hypothetical protein
MRTQMTEIGIVILLTAIIVFWGTIAALVRKHGQKRTD